MTAHFHQDRLPMTRRQLVLLTALSPLWWTLAACQVGPQPTPGAPVGSECGIKTFIYFYTDN